MQISHCKTPSNNKILEFGSYTLNELFVTKLLQQRGEKVKKNGTKWSEKSPFYPLGSGVECTHTLLLRPALAGCTAARAHKHTRTAVPKKRPELKDKAEV